MQNFKGKLLGPEGHCGSLHPGVCASPREAQPVDVRHAYLCGPPSCPLFQCRWWQLPLAVRHLGNLDLAVSQVTVPFSERHHPLSHGELASEADNRSCKPIKGSQEPRVSAQFPYLHDLEEEKSDQTHVYILRMNR